MLARKIKLRLNKSQKAAFKSASENSSQLYNDLLKINFDRLDSGQKTLTAFDMSKLCISKNIRYGLGSDVLQAICKRLDINLRRWQESERVKLWFWLNFGGDYKKPMKASLTKKGKKLWGRPRFKVKGISIEYPVRPTHQSQVRVFGKQTSVSVPLLGRIKGYNDRQEILGLVKQVSVGRDSCGQWWATIICDGKNPSEDIESRSKSIGVDLGLKHTITAANESETIQPERERFLEKQLAAIKKAFNKNRRDLPFIYRKIARRRKHSHHVQARRLIQAADFIFVGNLNSRFLFSGKLARSASDAAHSQFLSILSYKASNAGKTVKIVNEAYTSQTCYKCKNRKKMPLEDRHYLCVCGYSNDRDVNAALNILSVGEKQHLVAL